jgi:flagellar biosynthesis protein FlhF
MKISRFFGANSRDVMRQVRQVLGPDALIVSNRSVDGGVEVLATVEGAFDDAAHEAAPRPSGRPKRRRLWACASICLSRQGARPRL